MLFVTFNDSPDGIYQSQVIDVCNFLHEITETDIELLAFCSIRTFLKDRKIIKGAVGKSTVLPLFPGIDNWRANKFTFRLFMLFRKRQPAIARGVFATLLALYSNKITSVTFDARGAYAAEWKEYMSEDSPKIVNEIDVLESEAVSRADFRIAVSEQLVLYWNNNYGYNGNRHLVIPCTLNSHSPNHTVQADLRKKWGVTDTEVLLVFSGSSAKWQSMDALYSKLKDAFLLNCSLKLLLLSKDNPEASFSTLYPDRIIREWVEPNMVAAYLSQADYGLLYRENTITNRVSSPVKFAQYLDAGLPVIISDNVGDYSKFTIDNGCGLLFSSIDWRVLKRPSPVEKLRMKGVAQQFFTKQAHIANYKRLIECQREKM